MIPYCWRWPCTDSCCRLAASEANTAGDVILFEEDKRFSRETVTIAAGADLTPGAVLGKITASGKYMLSAPAAVDGSQTPVAVLVRDADAATVDAVSVALLRPAKVSRSALVFDSTINDATKRQTAVDALAAVGILTDA